MAKKHKHPEHVNHERWLVSYADFITLLFAFFVVMFSTSQTDSNKVGRFSESFVQSMGIHVLQGSVGVFDGTNSPFSSLRNSNVKYLHNQKGQLVEIENQLNALKRVVEAAGGDPAKLNDLADRIETDPKLRIALGSGQSEEDGKGKPEGPGGEQDGGTGKDGAQGKAGSRGSGDQAAGDVGRGDKGPGEGEVGDVSTVSVTAGDGAASGKGNGEPTEAPLGFRILRRRTELVLRLDNDVLFRSGSDELDPRALPLLEALGKELKEKPVVIKVEGHADTRPINTPRYPSNWHLSSARATAVVLVLAQKSGIPPARLGAAGFGEHQPVASNDTDEGRSKNRRVDIVIGLDPTVEDEPEAGKLEGDVKGAAEKAREAADAVRTESEAGERPSAAEDRPAKTGRGPEKKGTERATRGPRER
ncbi:MAG: OmpA family protein [Deltaproteobacteria bacterium]|nr:OmpA family protein [Deltaproteobacteria bacterium]